MLFAPLSWTIALSTNHPYHSIYNRNQNWSIHWRFSKQACQDPRIADVRNAQGSQEGSARKCGLCPCNLGGGQHGYLGAIIDAPSYAIMAGNNMIGAAQPFTAPPFPGMLRVVVGLTAAAREEEMFAFNAKHACMEGLWQCNEGSMKANPHGHQGHLSQPTQGSTHWI